MKMSTRLLRLEEMQEYCETRLDCRRKTFAHFFGSGDDNMGFNSCGDMCDNCIRSAGKKIRHFNADAGGKAPAGGGFCPAAQLLSDATGAKKRPIAPLRADTKDSFAEEDDASSFLAEAGVSARLSTELYSRSSGKIGKIQFMKASELKR